MTTLTKGQKYHTAALTHEGWTDGDGTGHEGYSCWDYFAPDGTYLGPDDYGVEPIFAMTYDFRTAVATPNDAWSDTWEVRAKGPDGQLWTVSDSTTMSKGDADWLANEMRAEATPAC